jgi:hypothetical protein
LLDQLRHVHAAHAAQRVRDRGRRFHEGHEVCRRLHGRQRRIVGYGYADYRAHEVRRGTHIAACGESLNGLFTEDGEIRGFALREPLDDGCGCRELDRHRHARARRQQGLDLLNGALQGDRRKDLDGGFLRDRP